MGARRTLGVNGLGRIGKMVLWYHLARDDFDRLVVNVGRPVGRSLDAVVQYIAKDSTYGPLHRFLHGQSGVRDMRVVDEAFDRIDVGGLMVNDVPTFRIDHMPYGGVKSSGLGREGLRYAIEEMTELKLLMTNRS